MCSIVRRRGKVSYYPYWCDCISAKLNTEGNCLRPKACSIEGTPTTIVSVRLAVWRVDHPWHILLAHFSHNSPLLTYSSPTPHALITPSTYSLVAGTPGNNIITHRSLVILHGRVSLVLSVSYNSFTACVCCYYQQFVVLIVSVIGRCALRMAGSHVLGLDSPCLSEQSG